MGKRCNFAITNIINNTNMNNQEETIKLLYYRIKALEKRNESNELKIKQYEDRVFERELPAKFNTSLDDNLR